MTSKWNDVYEIFSLEVLGLGFKWVQGIYGKIEICKSAEGDTTVFYLDITYHLESAFVFCNLIEFSGQVNKEGRMDKLRFPLFRVGFNLPIFCSGQEYIPIS